MTYSAPRIKQDLARAYRFLAHFGMDDLTYTHLSARVPGEDAYYIYPFGLLYEEVTADTLLKVTLDGRILEGEEYQYNATGYVIHGNIYQARKDVNAISHLHTTAGVAVASMKEGLLPISQFSYHFFEQLGVYGYDSLALEHDHHGADLVKALGEKKCLLLANHGTLCTGTTIQEMFFYTYYLEQACKVQLAALATGRELIIPTAQVCRKARDDMRAFEADLGQRDWQALIRTLENSAQKVPALKRAG